MKDEKKKKVDWNSPETQAVIRRIYDDTFTREGLMVAFPPCFPGVTLPIAADESHITALDITPDGIVYGGTSGRCSHLFFAAFHSTTGIVFDLGTVAGGERCAAVCAGTKSFFACVNGKRGGGRVVASELHRSDLDLIEEWGFRRKPFRDLGTVDGEPVIHAVSDANRKRMVGVTSRHLFTVDFESSRIDIAGEVPGAGRLGVGANGAVVGADGAGHLWRYNPDSGLLQRRAVALPEGKWDPSLLLWSRSRQPGLLYTADSDGRIFSFDERLGFSAVLGRAPLAPVRTLAASVDGRVYGFCGDEINRMFCYRPARKEVTDLGSAVSVIERRRYGFIFSDAAIGRDGEIYFGEDDNLGHLWLYFPKLEAGA
ncbi:MAG: hypothetical protein ACM336_08615 [Acidobacteriota bacterium]